VGYYQDQYRSSVAGPEFCLAQELFSQMMIRKIRSLIVKEVGQVVVAEAASQVPTRYLAECDVSFD